MVLPFVLLGVYWCVGVVMVCQLGACAPPWFARPLLLLSELGPLAVCLHNGLESLVSCSGLFSS